VTACQARSAAAAIAAILTALFRTSAILDGLRQKSCNGKVTEMHETLIRHAVE